MKQDMSDILIVMYSIESHTMICIKLNKAVYYAIDNGIEYVHKTQLTIALALYLIQNARCLNTTSNLKSVIILFQHSPVLVFTSAHIM